MLNTTDMGLARRKTLELCIAFLKSHVTNCHNNNLPKLGLCCRDVVAVRNVIILYIIIVLYYYNTIINISIHTSYVPGM